MRHFMDFKLIAPRRSWTAMNWILLVCLGPITKVGLCSPVAPPVPASRSSALIVGVGEIKLDGVIGSIDTTHRTLILNVDAFTLPTGKTKRLAVQKTKTVAIQDGTKLWQMQPTTKTWRLADLEPGTPVSIIGRDFGSGHELPARLILMGDAEDPAARPRRPIDRASMVAEANYILASRTMIKATVADLRGFAVCLRQAATALRAQNTSDLQHAHAAAVRYTNHEHSLIATWDQEVTPERLRHLRDLVHQYLVITGNWLNAYTRFLSTQQDADISQAPHLHAIGQDLLAQIQGEFDTWKLEHGIRTGPDDTAAE